MTRTVLCLLALAGVSCAELEVPEGAAGGAADEVGVATEALGSWSERYHVQTITGRRGSLTSQYAVWAGHPQCGEPNRRVEAVFTAAALPLNPPLIPDGPGCEYITLTRGGGNELFVFDQGNSRIYRLMLDANWNYYWLHVATTPGDNVTKIRHNGTYVVWSDEDGTHRAPIGGGGVTNLAAAGTELIDMEGSILYLDRYNPGSANYTLQSMPVTGGPATSLRTMPQSFQGLTFNANHFYFTNITQPHNIYVIYKLTKSGSTLSTFHDVPMNSMPVSLKVNATHLYWIKWDDYRIQRRRLSDEKHSDIGCPGARCNELALSSDYLYAIGNEPDDTNHQSLYRGQL